jgi:hypothetical protein
MSLIEELDRVADKTRATYAPTDYCRPCGSGQPRGEHPNQNGVLINELLGGDGPHTPFPWRDLDFAELDPVEDPELDRVEL